MALSKCPVCGSRNVNNFPLNTNEQGYPDDDTYAGECMDCGFEEPYEYNEKGNFYYLPRGNK